MAHYKRYRPKHRRAGCLCGSKVYKDNDFKGTKEALRLSERKSLLGMKEACKEVA